MAFKLIVSKSDRLRFISSLDPAVDTSTEEQKEQYRKYLEDHDEGRLTLAGKPVVWLLRPLDMATYEHALTYTKGLAVPGLYTDAPSARELFRLSVDEIENYPEDWSAKDSVFSWEYRQKCLSDAAVRNLPSGLVREGAAMLLGTLPLATAKVTTTEDGREVETADSPAKKKPVG